MGLQITTDNKPVMVFRNDDGQFPRYCIGVSSKDKDGNWVNGYISCRFKKGESLDNKTEIHIKNSFPVLSKSKDGKVYKEIMITEYSVVGNEMPEIKPEELPWD